MFAAPHEGRVFKGTSSEEEGEELDGPVGLEGEVGEEAVVSKGDGEPARAEHEEEEGDLESVDPVVPDVERDSDQGNEEGSDKEGAGGPVDPVEGNARKEALEHKERSWV